MGRLPALLAGLILAGSALAKEAPPAAADPLLEQRVMALASELRCLVCQNQTIADSHAELAIDLKNQVREKLKQGESEAKIIDYMVARYGDFVLYKPPMKATTLALWIGPFVLMLGALVGLYYYISRRRRSEPEQALNADEEARLRTLLDAPKDKP
ncbi:MAG: cytochrome c-type biogenesis protein CcmH [Betaproteobacteria bacterium]|nr:MAG: cytochrome c-type biogenesis protein CcmH [Betaproteobacteria bacterium]